MAHTPHAAMRGMRRRPGGAISLVHLFVLNVLDADGALSMRALADAIDVSQASTTGIVDRMEQRGLVVRDRDLKDRRIVRVSLTDDGRGVLSGFAVERRDAISGILDELSDAELTGFLAGARALRLARERHLRRLAEGDAGASPEREPGR